MVTTVGVFCSTGFTGDGLGQLAKIRSRAALLRRCTHALTHIVNRLLRNLNMLTGGPLRLFKKSAISIQNAIH